MATKDTKQIEAFVWEGTDRRGKRVKGEMRGSSPALIKADLRRQGIVAHQADVPERHQFRTGAGEEVGDVVDEDAAIEGGVDEEPAPSGVEVEPQRSGTGRRAAELGTRGGVEDQHLVVEREADEGQIAQGREVHSMSRRSSMRSSLSTRSSRETMLRTVFSKVSACPSCWRPRWTLSFLEGIQARRPSGLMATSLR